MRKVLLRRRRRGGAVDPITAAYDAIYAESEAAILTLLPVYRGQQMLWQDLDGESSPVEDPADPVGAIRDRDGNLIAQAPTLGDRGVWSPTQGIIFSGSQQYDLSSEWQIPPNVNQSIYVDTVRELDPFAALLGWASGGSAIAYLLAQTTNERFSLRVGQTGGAAANSANNAFPNGRRILASVADTSDYVGYVDLAAVNGQAVGSSTPAGSVVAKLGARNTGTGAGEFFYTGSIASAVYYSEVHDATKRAEIDALLRGMTT